ncbi:MAG: translation initiation factor [Candidatus Aenigmarchaeota archaeon]|nr:translation initiation factor [Candidatus Aenigmarchaeota archaeon]
MAVCPKCGLPKELCVCETIAKESRKITINTQQKRYGKYTTVIKGIDEKQISLREVTTKLKSKLACGGTHKNGEIELQGNHKEKVKKILVQEGFPEDMIEVK